MSRPGAVLVLRALGLGDLLTAVPALRALARVHPERPLVLAAPAWLEPVVSRIGCVGTLIPADPLRPLPANAHGAALGVNLHGSGPQSHRVLEAAAPRERIAFRHPEVPWSSTGPEWARGDHEVVRWCRLLGHFGIVADPGDLRIERPAWVVRRPDVTVVHPGASSGARRWPVERFAAVARSERERGRRVVVTGSAAEIAACCDVVASAGLPQTALAVGGGLDRLIDLVAAAGRLVCGDTGPAHLATALGTPSVVLFGPTPPAQWGALADPSRHREIWMGAAGDPHAAHADPGLLRIDVDRVLSEIEQLDGA
jgi:ADP-heptose:LPS heptosyltransferase